ncbi:MAG TPA: Asp-tRNA(Asn)/Glu-tRNA(Gln) amidotransferase subunit GatC [Candidatus Limnocylindrales bacterium]|nr:Asp-tRNA(Asn)/Glu-tRNA(Gln) amidotransferase subunit GatC [Candidatus Limnocylindrales bacterium]
MSITRADIERVAVLARLHLTGEEVDRLTTDLGRILEYVGKLGELDTTHVEPTSSVVAMSTPFREDAVTTGGDPDSAVANAPRRDDHYFVVPRIIE